MDVETGIVVPAYGADPERLSAYIAALRSALEPARIHVEADDPDPAILSMLDGTVATVGVSARRRGKGAAIAEGFDRLDTPVLAFVDADGSTPPSSVGAVIDPVVRGRADLAVGSRRHPDARVRVHQSRVRRRLGDLLAWIARRLLPVRLYDYQCGAKAIDRDTWELVRGDLASTGFAWDIELVTIADALGARVQEVPITWDDKPGSTVGLAATPPSFLRALLRARHRGACIRGHRGHLVLDRLVRATGLAGGDSANVEAPPEEG